MKDLVVTAITDTLNALKAAGTLRLDAGVPGFTVEPPKQAAHGDFAVNVAMMLSKPEGKPPRAIAEAIVAGLVDHAGMVSAVEIAGPGFLNVRLHDKAFHDVVARVAASGDRWGHSEKTGKKVLVEFVSANPTGPVHIGHARGTFVGDAVSRLLKAAGHDVTKEFYVNDFGKQVETLGRTVFKRYRELHGESIALVEGEYPAAYVIDIAKAWQAKDGDQWMAKGLDDAAALARAMEMGISENLRAIKETLALANVEHDIFASEAAVHAAGLVKDIVGFYASRDATYEATAAHDTEDSVRKPGSKAAQFEDKQLGGTFLKTSEHGDDEDRIILRKDGTPVYLTADLAYHKQKFDRGFDRIIDVFGADHAGHVPRLKAGMTLAGFDAKKLDFVLVQIVRLVRDGVEVKVSKRKGTVFELRDLIEEVGADACRFLFLMKTANAQIEFDFAVVEKQSKDNPVFYFQYGHARCAAILRKAVEKEQTFVGLHAVPAASLARLTLPEEKALLKKISQLPEVVAGAANALEPHRVLYFCQELIADFHSYYSKYSRTERVVSDDRELTQGRLALVASLKKTLQSAFSILGVDAPEQMAMQADDDAADAADAAEGA
jgi:arginyl-tRNA synthetase